MRRALLLDRDGVINVDRRYVYRIEDFVWQDRIIDLIKAARSVDFLPVVVTNQSGIGRGLYTETDYRLLNDWMRAHLERMGAPIEHIYHCPYHPDAVIPHLRAAHPWRKPQPGMILAARDDLDLDLPRSIMIGDNWTDVQAAAAAGVGTCALVGTSVGPAPPNVPTPLRFSTVAEAFDWFTTNVIQT